MSRNRRRKFIRGGLIVGNLLLLLVVGLFIFFNRSASQTVRANTLSGAVTTADESATNPLDTLSSAQIALTAAQLGHLPELTVIRNQADSDSLILDVPPSDSSSLSKPQLVATAEKSRQDIIHYTTQPGDTVASLAKKFKVSADSIRWSNNLSGNGLTAGLKLSIPPINGIVYTVKKGDTPASLATRFSANESQIIDLNDAEINGLKPGEQVIIPNGKIAPAVTYGNYSLSYSSFSAVYGGNAYDFGTCTWYVASQISVPSNWGNANTWAIAAAASGWTVSSVPRVGAIAQTTGMSYLGHVAIVTAVSADGSQITYKDMNDPYWDVVTTHTGPASTYEHYIYH
ncbi:MAG TPA: LysM peptidoglycan-binding domain-containing protein [Candidatus Saccharimonadales bacterium]|nr:LysM peptidoglycan-binding domain-containing protein [Candidatus Saccharimonadales bacterium]